MHKFNLNFTGLYNFEVYWTTLQTLLVNGYISFKIRSRINGIACFMLLVWIYHSKIFHFVFIILIIIIMTLWLVCSQEMERINKVVSIGIPTFCLEYLLLTEFKVLGCTATYKTSFFLFWFISQVWSAQTINASRKINWSLVTYCPGPSCSKAV